MSASDVRAAEYHVSMLGALVLFGAVGIAFYATWFQDLPRRWTLLGCVVPLAVAGIGIRRASDRARVAGGVVAITVGALALAMPHIGRPMPVRHIESVFPIVCVAAGIFAFLPTTVRSFRRVRAAREGSGAAS